MYVEVLVGKKSIVCIIIILANALILFCTNTGRIRMINLNLSLPNALLISLKIIDTGC